MIVERVLPIDCTVNNDTIADVKIKICEKDEECKIAHWKLYLYSPGSPVKDNLTKENLVHLHPRRQISSNFPQSNDPDIDIIIIRSQGQQQSAATQALDSSYNQKPCRIPWMGPLLPGDCNLKTPPLDREGFIHEEKSRRKFSEIFN